jgi:hypothetical protein
LTEDGWRPRFGLDVINVSPVAFAGLFLFVSCSRMLLVDRWTFLVHPSESLGLFVVVIWRHPFMTVAVGGHCVWLVGL